MGGRDRGGIIKKDREQAGIEIEKRWEREKFYKERPGWG